MLMEAINLAIVALIVLGFAALFVAWFRSVNQETGAVEQMGPFDPTLDHQLRQQIVPYIVSAERLWRHPPYLVFSGYSYTRELLAAVVGAGLLPPAFAFYNSLLKEQSGAPSGGAIHVPLGLTVSGAAVAAVLIAIRTLFSKINLPKRFILAESCRTEFRVLNAKMMRIVETSQAVSVELSRISNELSTILLRNVAENSWPYNLTAPGIDDLIERRTNSILSQMIRVNATASSPRIQQRES